MRLPEIEKLHKKALTEMQLIADGKNRDGFAALMQGARYLAVAEICQALRRDFASAGHVDNAPSPVVESPQIR